MSHLENEEPNEDIDLDDIIAHAKEAQAAHKDVYREAESDLVFYDAANQWDDAAYKKRTKMGRHAITHNRLPQFVHLVVNQFRQNTPSIKTIPADGGADQETAEVIQDYIRNIEYISNADIAYEVAMDNAVKCSLGWFRLDHDYTAPDSFEQHILIKPIMNPLSVMVNPDSVMPDGSDIRWAFVFDKLPRETFKKEYPDAKPENFDAGFMNRFASPFATADDSIMIAEYFCLKQEKVLIYQLENGEVVEATNYDKLPLQFQIVNKKEMVKNQCYRYKCTGAEILEEGVFPSSYIPIIPVYGEIHWEGGKRKIFSLIRDAKDGQRMYNYAKSIEMDLIAKAPKAPYIAAEGQLANYEDAWRNPDDSNVLIYKQVDAKGQPAPPPRRVEPIMVNPAISNLAMGAIEDMKASMGIYDPSLGQREGNKSGKAILAEQQQGDIANYHFSDNAARSIRFAGVVIVDMMQRLIDTPRIIRVIGEDGTPRNVGVQVGGQMPAQMQGIEGIYDINAGKYDVIVTTGPSYASKRSQMAEVLVQLSQSNPIIAQAAPDLLVDALDIPGKDAIVERIKRALPPNLTAKEGVEDPEKAGMVQQLEQMGQQMQAMQAELASKQGEQQVKMAEIEVKKMELALREQELQIEGASTSAQGNLEVVKLRLDDENKEKDRQATLAKAKMDNETKLIIAGINKIPVEQPETEVENEYVE